MRAPRGYRPGSARESGYMLVVSLLLLTLLTALTAAHTIVIQRNQRLSHFMGSLGDLRGYADAGVNLAIHELHYGVGGTDGDIGTESWSTSNDLGRDGVAGTYDEGEGDGIPTPGEPSLTASAIGPTAAGNRLLVNTSDSGWPFIVRIVSTAYNPDAIAAVEVYAERYNAPDVGAVYVNPAAVLAMAGNNFLIKGADTNPDGTAGPNADLPGLATAAGTPAGTNASLISAQVLPGQQDQVVGLGADPSVGETEAVDVQAYFDDYTSRATNLVSGGIYSTGTTWGNHLTSDFETTYVSGNVELSGNFKGAGVLVVDGNLKMSGQSQFVGVVIVRGDVWLTGGGSGVHVYGSLMLAPSPSDPTMNFRIEGTSDVVYSSQAVAWASNLLEPRYTVLYWNAMK